MDVRRTCMRRLTAGPSALTLTMIAAGNYGEMVRWKSFRSNIHAVPALVNHVVVSATTYIMTRSLQIPQTTLDRVMS